MKREFWRGGCALLLALLAALPGNVAARPGQSEAATATLLAADARGLWLELVSPSPTLTEQATGTDRFVGVEIPGLAAGAAVGAPRLPAYARLIALPPGTAASVHVVVQSSRALPLARPPLPEPTQTSGWDNVRLLPVPGPRAYTPNPALYAGGLYPASPVQLDAPFDWRGQRVARLRIAPIQFDPANSALIHHSRLLVEVRFQGGDLIAQGETPAPDPHFDALRRSLLLNADTAAGWRAAAAPASAQLRPQDDRPWLKISAGKAGAYALTCAALAQAGVDLSRFDPASAQLFADRRDGVEVALALKNGGAPDRCDGDDRLLFWAAAGESRYSSLAVYWLTYGAAQGKRMTERPSLAEGVPVTTTPTLRHREENRFYQPQLPRELDYEHWFWKMHSTNRAYWPASRPYTFTLESGAVARSLSVALAGDAAVHRTRVHINGLLLGQVEWAGAVAFTPTFPLPVGALLAGTHLISITEVAPNPSLVAVDSFALAVERPLQAVDDRLDFAPPAAGRWRFQAQGFSAADLLLWDITDPRNPVRISGFQTSADCPCALAFGDESAAATRYVAIGSAGLLHPLAIEGYTPSHLRDSANAADYILIAPAPLAAAIAPLATWRAAQGLRVLTVTPQAIYDEFGRGLPEPAALRAFLRYAYDHWRPPAPAYVLLVGDGHYDPKGYCLAAGACDNGLVTPPDANLIPPNLELVDPWLGETAADNRLVAFDAGSPLPWMALGRLPVASAAEASAMVAKILAYEQAPNNQAWRTRLAFVADNAYDAQGQPDPAGNFWTLSDRIADDPRLRPPAFSASRYYLNICDPQHSPQCALADPPYPPYTSGAAITDGLVSAFNSGHLIVSYSGHGSIAAWGGAPTLLRTTDLPRFTNRERLPLILDMTCYTGFYHRPGAELSSLAELLVRHPDGGAIAAWSSTGLGLVNGHDLMSAGFLEALMQRGVRRAGLAALAGLTNLYVQGQGAHLENVDTFLLLGDPALRLTLPGDGRIYLPMVKGS